mmetsp:Transcript_3280/g.12510  ORF Transcript_3280/g.12510 Transcript_3280/m.12510 type:complete len:101 (+) Transcript_3280:4113-4415(+)
MELGTTVGFGADPCTGGDMEEMLSLNPALLWCVPKQHLQNTTVSRINMHHQRIQPGFQPSEKMAAGLECRFENDFGDGVMQLTRDTLVAHFSVLVVQKLR